MPRIFAASAALLLFCAASTSAVEPKHHDREVRIDNLHGNLIIYDNPKEPAPGTGQADHWRPRTIKLRATQTLTIAANEIVTVGIEHQNPLVFVYKWKGVVLTPTEDYNAAVAFAKSLTKLSGIDPLQQHAQAAAAHTAGLAPAAKAVLDQRYSRVREIVEKAGFTGDVAQKLAKLRNDLTDDVSSITDRTKDTLDDAKVAGVQDKVRNWDTGTKAKDTDDLFKIVLNARSALLSELANTPDLFQEDTGLVTTVEMFASEEANVRRLLKSAVDFAKSVALVGKALPLGDEIPFDPANTATATVSISVVDGMEPLVKEVLNGRPLLTGDYAVTFEPYSAIALGGGVSAVYVFNDSKATGDAIGWRPVGMLTVGARSLLNGLTFPHLEFGVTPESDRIGLYAGGGLRVKGVFNISVGFSLQEYKTGGKPAWQPTGYLGLTVDLAQKP